MVKLSKAIMMLALFPLSLTAQVEIGEMVPAFSYTSFDNEVISSSDLAGKIIYGFIFGASCPHCQSNGGTTETSIYQMFRPDTNFVALGFQVWSNQTVSHLNEFLNSTKITYPLLLEARQTMLDIYGPSGGGNYDRSIVIGADGTLKYKGTGYVNTDYNDVIAVIQSELHAPPTSSEENTRVPGQHQLIQNYPNPFNPSTTISYRLHESGKLRIQILNVIGKEVATLVNGILPEGEHSVVWDATGYPSGIYFYRLTTASQSITKKMLLVK